MRNEITVPDDFKRKVELRELLKKILNVVTLDSVFISQEQGEGDDGYHFVTLIVDANLERVPGQIRSLIQEMAQGHPYFKIRLYAEDQLLEGLEKGQLFFLQHCCFGTEVYSNALTESRVAYDGMPWKDFVAKAGDRLIASHKKIYTHTMQADLLTEKGNHRESVLEMHKAFMGCFRFLEQMGLGQEVSSPLVIDHVAYCLEYYPKLNVFSYASESYCPNLLTLLDQLPYNKNSHYPPEVSGEDILGIRSGLKKFNKEVLEIYSKMLESCEGLIEQRLSGPLEPVGSYLETFDQEEDAELGEETPDTNQETKEDASPMDHIRALKEQYSDTLTQRPGHKLYHLQLSAEGHLDIAFKMANILQVCVMALNAEWPERPFSDPCHTIGEVISHALELMPYGELEFLDKLNELLDGSIGGTKEYA